MYWNVLDIFVVAFNLAPGRCFFQSYDTLATNNLKKTLI